MKYKKDFYEEFAKVVLQHFYSEKFENLIKGESPDFCNKNVGLEVTRAISTSDGEFDSFLKNNLGKKLSDISDGFLKKLGFKESPVATGKGAMLYAQQSKKNGTLWYFNDYKHSAFILCGATSRLEDLTVGAKEIVEKVINKTKKLNDNYERKNENDLVVLVQEQLDYIVGADDIKNSLLTECIERLKLAYRESYPYKFNYLYLLFYDNLFVIDSEYNITHHPISAQQLNELVINAKN